MSRVPAAAPADRGFSLIEVLVSLSLSVVILTGLASAVPRAAALSRLAREDTRAALEAGAQMEKLLRLPFSAADWTAGSHTLTVNGYQVRWFVAVDSPGPGSRTVAVTAQRPSSRRSVRLVTLRAR